MARAILHAQKSTIMTTITKYTSFVSAVERTTAAYPEYTEVHVSVMGIWYTSGRRGKVCSAVEHDEITFSDLSVAVPWMARKTSTISSGANTRKMLHHPGASLSD